MSYKLPMGIVDGKQVYMVVDGVPPPRVVSHLLRAWADTIERRLRMRDTVLAEVGVSPYIKTS